MENLVEQIGEVRGLVEGKLRDLEARQSRLQAMVERPGVGGGPEAGPETRALGAYLRRGDVAGLESKALSIVNDGQGVVVRADWSDRIYKLVREFSPVRAVASVQRTTTERLEVLVDRGEPGSGWVAETGARDVTATDFLSRHQIATAEHYARPAVTTHLLQDAEFDVEAWLQEKVAARFAREEAAAFINGDGAGKPRGLLHYGTVPEAEFDWGDDPAEYEIGAVYTGVDAGLPAKGAGADKLIDLVDALKPAYLPGASWLMTRAFRNLVRKLKDDDDRSLYHMSLQDGVPDRLLGYPVRLAEDMPGLVTDAVGALFGDFAQAYVIVDRVGLQVLRDPYTAPGFVRYYVSTRLGGAMTNPEAVKALVLGSEPDDD